MLLSHIMVLATRGLAVKVKVTRKQKTGVFVTVFVTEIPKPDAVLTT